MSYIPLIGGERAVKNPWLVSLAYLIEYFGEEEGVSLAHKFLGDTSEISFAVRILSSGINCPLASSTGRLFDAVSALLGICRETTYEGQPAIELGELATGVTEEDYGSMLVDTSVKPFVLSPEFIFRGLLRDMEKGETLEKMSTKFHNSLICTIADTVEAIRSETGLTKVVFSGDLS